MDDDLLDDNDHLTSIPRLLTLNNGKIKLIAFCNHSQNGAVVCFYDLIKAKETIKLKNAEMFVGSLASSSQQESDLLFCSSANDLNGVKYFLLKLSIQLLSEMPSEFI